MRRSIATLAFFLPAFVLACGSPDDPRGEGWDDEGKADGFGTSSGSELPEVAGVYGLHVRSDVIVAELLDDGSRSGRTTTYSSELFGLVTMDNEGTSLALVIQPCQVTLPELDGRQPSIDDALFDVIPPITTSGVLFVDETTRLNMATDPTVMTLGVSLDDPLADPLPRDADSPSVFDQDGDGRPGITVDISGWSVYVGLRAVFDLVGELGDDGRFTGECELTMESEIYGDNIPLFDARSAAESSAGENEVISEEHRFVLVPVDASSTGASCEALLSSNIFE